MAQRPQPADEREQGKRVEVLPPHRRVDRPPRVDKRQVGRPRELAEIEPDRASGDEHAVDCGELESRSASADEDPLGPHRERAEGRRGREERQQRQSVALRVQASPLPPEHHEQQCRQGGRHGLAQEGRAEEREREQPRGRAPAPVEPQIGQRCGEEEGTRLGVLQLRDPRHRLHVHRMKREHERREPRPWHREPAENQPEQECRERVQADVEQVIGERVAAGQPMERPERGVEQRVVLLCGARLGPDPRQAVDPAQLRPRYVRVVIPQQAAVPRRLVGRDRDGEERGEHQPLRQTPLGRACCSWRGWLARAGRHRARVYPRLSSLSPCPVPRAPNSPPA